VEANAELERQYVAVVGAPRVKDEFLANVSYELRTPLTAVMGYLSILSERISGPLTVEQFDPRVPLREALRVAKGLPAGVQLIAEEPVLALPAAHSDRRKITRILVSLLSNAFKFTAKGEVRASVNVANGRGVYSVQDTGIGIEPSAQVLVFDE